MVERAVWLLRRLRRVYEGVLLSVLRGGRDLRAVRPGLVLGGLPALQPRRLLLPLHLHGPAARKEGYRRLVLRRLHGRVLLRLLSNDARAARGPRVLSHHIAQLAYRRYSQPREAICFLFFLV